MATTAEQQSTAKDDKPKKPPRPVGEIQADISKTRARLAANLDQLKTETSPKVLGARAATTAKSVFVNEDGSVKVERVAAVAGVAVTLLLMRKGLKTRAEKKRLKALAEIVWVPVPRRSVNPEIAGLARNAKELAPLSKEFAPQLALAGA